MDTTTKEYAERIGCPDWMPDEGCIRFFRHPSGWTERLPCACRVDALALAAVADALAQSSDAGMDTAACDDCRGGSQ